MSGQLRSTFSQKCLIRGRRLLCSVDTSKSPKNTFSTFRSKANETYSTIRSKANETYSTIRSKAKKIFELPEDKWKSFSLATLATAIIAAYPAYKAIFEDTKPLIMKAIAGDLTRKLCEMTASITESDNVSDGCDYVTRPSLENRILQACEQSLKNKGGGYTIIVGAKGAGKTTVVARVLREKKGVVAMLVSDNDTPESLILKLVKKCGIEVKHDVKIDLEDFGPVLKKAAAIRKGHPITIVFEEERSSASVAILNLIKNFAKYLAVYASVIIVLSEANAGLVFGDDERQKIIWVDEMDTGEAKEYARKVHPGVTDADLELLFDKVGKLPLKILNSMTALKEGIPLAQIIEDYVLAADTDLAAFALQPILAALKASPDGVDARAFKGVEYKGINLAQPKQVAVFMKEVNCLAYHMPSKQYRLASRTHRTALMQYQVPNNFYSFLFSLGGALFSPVKVVDPPKSPPVVVK